MPRHRFVSAPPPRVHVPTAAHTAALIGCSGYATVTARLPWNATGAGTFGNVAKRTPAARRVRKATGPRKPRSAGLPMPSRSRRWHAVASGTEEPHGPQSRSHHRGGSVTPFRWAKHGRIVAWAVRHRGRDGRVRAVRNRPDRRRRSTGSRARRRTSRVIRVPAPEHGRSTKVSPGPIQGSAGSNQLSGDTTTASPGRHGDAWKWSNRERDGSTHPCSDTRTDPLPWDAEQVPLAVREHQHLEHAHRPRRGLRPGPHRRAHHPDPDL